MGHRHLGLAAYAAILYYFTMPDKKRTAGLDWEDIRYFVALARYGTLSETARRLRVNHATVARRISSLETLLGRTLFERRPDGYALSAEGKAVLDEARYMDEAALSVLRRLDAGTELSGMVRLTVGRVLAERFLIERLRAFHELYPAIDLEVIGGSRSVSLARRGADIALRVGRRLLASTKRATSLPKPGGLRASLATASHSTTLRTDAGCGSTCGLRRRASPAIRGSRRSGPRAGFARKTPPRTRVVAPDPS